MLWYTQMDANDGSEILATQNRTIFFSKTFRSFRSFDKNLRSRAETIRLVRKSSDLKLSSRFFDRLKIFIGLGSQNSY